jgi:two-component system chemotaxis response regulator CheY
MAYNLLIVDDSKTVRSVITKALRAAGIPTNLVLEAQNGLEALDLLRNNWIDLVLADINMPVMNGVEMLERMKADADLEATPVVVVSTEGSSTRIARLEELGVRFFLRKPFRPEQLRDAIISNLGEIDAQH